MKNDNWLLLGLLGLGLLAGGIIAYAILNRQRPTYVVTPNQTSTIPNYVPTQKYLNKEEWNWTDWKGRERSITVKRDVKEYV